MPDRMNQPTSSPAILIDGVRYATGPHSVVRGAIKTADGKLMRLLRDDFGARMSLSKGMELDLHGFLVMPGLINAHDHLQYALYPRLGNPPYRNYVEWGDDIHETLSATLALHKSVPKNTRLWWGGIRNLLSGVTTVCHHNQLWPTLLQDGYPIKVVREYGWAHSLALDPDLREAHLTSPADGPFIVHACEGTDMLAQEELFGLHRLGVLDSRTVIVHGLALDAAGVELLQQQRVGLICCLSSNRFLYDRLPDTALLRRIQDIALGNDSPLTAAGDLLDEVRFAIQCGGIAPQQAYRMVTESPAAILRLTEGEGQIREHAAADLIAVRDAGGSPEDRLRTLTWKDIEFVMVAGQVRLASDDVWHLLPEELRRGLNPLWVEGQIRWLRVPVEELLQKAETALGAGRVRMGGRPIKMPDSAKSAYGTGFDSTAFHPIRGE